MVINIQSNAPLQNDLSTGIDDDDAFPKAHTSLVSSEDNQPQNIFTAMYHSDATINYSLGVALNYILPHPITWYTTSSKYILC